MDRPSSSTPTLRPQGPPSKIGSEHSSNRNNKRRPKNSDLVETVKNLDKDLSSTMNDNPHPQPSHADARATRAFVRYDRRAQVLQVPPAANANQTNITVTAPRTTSPHAASSSPTVNTDADNPLAAQLQALAASMTAGFSNMTTLIANQQNQINKLNSGATYYAIGSPNGPPASSSPSAQALSLIHI